MTTLPAKMGPISGSGEPSPIGLNLEQKIGCQIFANKIVSEQDQVNPSGTTLVTIKPVH
jgi:hypothetical protein